MSDRALIGHNRGPALVERLTSKTKLERIRQVLEMSITAAQKCVGIGMIIESDPDGMTSELSTKQLQRFAGAADRETVYRATKVLDGVLAETVKERGRPNRYRILPAHVVDAIVDVYNQAAASQDRPDPTSRVKPDGMPLLHPVGFDPTSPAEPVGFNPTSGVAADQPSRARIEPPSGVNIINKQPTTTTTVEQEAACASGGGDVLAALNGTATDIIGFIAKHAHVEADDARRMLATNIKTFTSQAMMEAYSVTIAEMAEGLVARPYKYLIEAARRIRDGAQRRSAAKGSSTDETRRERIRRLAEETEASIRGGRA